MRVKQDGLWPGMDHRPFAEHHGQSRRAVQVESQDTQIRTNSRLQSQRLSLGEKR
jgi:hypothetical protein